MRRRYHSRRDAPWWSRPSLLLGLFSVYALIVWGALIMVARFADSDQPTVPQTLKIADAPRR